MQNHKDRFLRLAFVLFVAAALGPIVTCGGGGGSGQGNGDGAGPGDPWVFAGTCVESLARCFDPTGSASCQGNLTSGSVSFVFESGARMNVTYDISLVPISITNLQASAVNSLGTTCYRVVQNPSGGALLTDARNGKQYVVTGEQQSDTEIVLTLEGPGCGPDLVTLDKNDPHNPLPGLDDIDFSQCPIPGQ